MDPITVKLQGRFFTGNGSQPPALREATVDFDRSGAVDATGLPVCQRSRLETRGMRAAQRACRSSIVGNGQARVAINSDVLSIPLALFNGGTRGGTTTLFIYGSGPMSISPSPVIAAVKLRKIPQGQYGLRAITKIPKIANGSGSLLGFNLKISRLFNYNGAKQSYAKARCSRGQLSASIGTSFSNGEALSGAVVQPCTPLG
jgi:hypothetical protein